MFLYDDFLTLMSSSERTQDLLNILHGKGYRVVGNLGHIMIVDINPKWIISNVHKGFVDSISTWTEENPLRVYEFI